MKKIFVPCDFSKPAINACRFALNTIARAGGTIHVFNDLNEGEGIINFTDTTNADMIAMGTRGRRGVAHLLSGTVTEGVVNQCSTNMFYI